MSTVLWSQILYNKVFPRLASTQVDEVTEEKENIFSQSMDEKM